MDIQVEEGATIPKQMEKLFKEDPEKPGFIFRDKNQNRSVLTRKDIWHKSRKFSAVLRGMGIVKGDIVCNTLVNSQERLITSLGTVLAGAVSMHGQLFLADGEDILKNWEDSQCKAVILAPNQKNGAASVLDRIKYVDEQTGKAGYKDLPYLTNIIPIVPGGLDTTESWFHSLDNETETYVDNSICNQDVAFIFTTSGSTGFAKLVPHTHESIICLGQMMSEHFRFNPESVYFNHRSFGWLGGVPVCYFASGVTRVVFDIVNGAPENFGEMVVKIFNEEKCDSALLLPSDIQFVLNSLHNRDSLDKCLRVCLTGGGPLSTVSMAAIGLFTDEIHVLYGGTEVGLIYSVSVTDPSTYENNCVGFAAECVETKILGENMEEVPFGETGEIYIRGPTVCKGYMNNIEKSKEVFLADGWYRSSDIGHFNEKGQLFVYCRKANAINHNGFIHYPGWMESRINKHPDIQKSVVVGIPEPVHHEDICLCLIKNPGANLTVDDVKEFCKTLFLTGEKDSMTPLPKYYFFLDAFPLNSNGKIDRRTLRDDMIKRLEK